ncbi:MAG: binding-protein-dependent transport system inner rane component [Acidimicrobiaceae bacterium]|jgi:multiple sugar transport system permease protein|nr:binding-protein-dependent transport system inner rane component [Acidimicrobiaceae bacterium]
MALTLRAPSRAVTRRRHRSAAGYSFVGAYVLLLLAFGAAPTAYALWLAFTTSAGGGFAGFGNFLQTARDFRFIPAAEHLAFYLGFWLVSLVVLVVGLALVVHSRGPRASKALRLAYYVPGALAGAASVIVWLFVLDPAVSPVAFILHAFGWSTFDEVISPGHLPVLFAIMAFWTGAGGWILVMYGALNNIPEELMESARLDGASPWQVALRIKLPLIRKWVAYMTILAFATGTQLFVEPQLVSQASVGIISPSWSPNQLAYVYAFQLDNFNGASAIAVDLLILGLICAVLIISRTGLFEAS